MKNLNKLALLVASAAIAMSAGCATSGAATGSVDNWANGNASTIWRTSDGLCWQTNYLTNETRAAECGGATAVAAVTTPDTTPEPTGAGAVSTKVSYSADAFFDFDKATLKPAGRQALDELIRRMGGMSNVEVVVATGHTDSTGPTSYNERLSLRRAEAVKAYLVDRGVPSNLIYVEGKGEAQPVADNRTRDGRAQNRRVEIEVVGIVTQ